MVIGLVWIIWGGNVLKSISNNGAGGGTWGPGLNTHGTPGSRGELFENFWERFEVSMNL